MNLKEEVTNLKFAAKKENSTDAAYDALSEIGEVLQEYLDETKGNRIFRFIKKVFNHVQMLNKIITIIMNFIKEQKKPN